MLASIHKTACQFKSKVRPFQPAASETVWQSNSKVPVPWCGKGDPRSEISLGDRSHVNHAAARRCRRSWMKTFVFVSIFTWNYASDSIRVHVSVTIIKYNTLLRDLGKLLGEVVKWFWPSTLRKTITRRSAGGPTDLVWAPVMSGSRLLRVTDRKNGVAVIRKRSKKIKILQNMLPDEFAITFYIMQLNWLCLN